MNILLIRLRLLGDVVFTTPAIRALRRRFPDARLTYLVEPEAAPVVRANPHLDRVIVSPRRRGIGRLVEDLRLAARLRSDRYDAVLDFHGGPRSSWLVWATGAPDRIGYAVTGRSWVYTHAVERPRELRPRHSVRNQWDLLASLDPAFERGPDSGIFAVEMPEEPPAAESAERRLREAGLQPRHTLVVVHASAGNPFRRWPESSFVDAIVRLARAEPGRRFIVTSGPSDEACARRVREAVRAALGSDPGPVIDPGELELPELRAVIARASLFIGGDSGPLHVASTTATPIVGLYGPTLPARSAPWRADAHVHEALEIDGLACRPCDQRVCEPGDYRCLTRIGADAVTAAAERALERAHRTAPESQPGRPALASPGAP